MRKIALFALLVLAGTPAIALAQGAPSLFKVITARDEVVIGLPTTDVESVAKKLVAEGQVTAWQYAVRRNASGATEQGPLRKVAILRQDTLRIEAYDAKPLTVVPLPQ